MHGADSSQELKRNRVNVYIDGFNLYHAIVALKDNRLKWINFFQLSKSMLRSNEILNEVNLFTAILTWNQDKQRRHHNFVAAQEAVGVTVHRGAFKRSNRICSTFDRACHFYEEKQTDVAIAIKMVSDALTNQFDRAILVTADSDQVPTAKAILNVPGKCLTLYYPPNRQSNARELGSVISDRRELTSGQLRTCLLPRTVNDKNGKAVAFMPALYQSAAG